MNVNGYGEISRQIGRMILQDLKVLSNQIQAGQKHFSYDFCACFIDEFGSFATRDFADFLKMARSSRIGIHLFCQGLSDLSRITSDLKIKLLGTQSTRFCSGRMWEVTLRSGQKWPGLFLPVKKLIR